MCISVELLNYKATTADRKAREDSEGLEYRSHFSTIIDTNWHVFVYARRNSQALENTDSWASHKPIKLGLRTNFW